MTEIKRALNHYVNTVLCAENRPDRPDPDDQAYRPADCDPKNHIYKAKRAFELSKLDQHNLKLNLKALTLTRTFSLARQPATTENDKHFTSQHNDTSAPENSGGGQFEQTFLWVHQTQWEKEMLVKYGNTTTLLDATYQTTMYDLALFFITV